jgi:hypothetical protein
MDNYIHQAAMCSTHSKYTSFQKKNKVVSQDGYVNMMKWQQKTTKSCQNTIPMPKLHTLSVHL